MIDPRWSDDWWLFGVCKKSSNTPSSFIGPFETRDEALNNKVAVRVAATRQGMTYILAQVSMWRDE